jgi:hypothetical protein
MTITGTCESGSISLRRLCNGSIGVRWSSSIAPAPMLFISAVSSDWMGKAT